MKYDALVIGGGIAGMESALKLGDMGYQVLLVEKAPSIGGKMILLSKVFPTLDCASCISTPKMAATIHHPNVTVLTYSEVKAIRSDGAGGFRALVRENARHVDLSACTGCRECEMVCNVAVPDEFNAGLVSRRAAFIAFPQAVPKKAVIERAGVSPCSFNCPAGIKAHGYVALVRSGQYEKAFQLVQETTPFVGTLGRACYAPCETECTRGLLEGAVSIRRLKRFIAERHHSSSQPEAPMSPNSTPSSGKKVAVVGSGPAGLTAAWHLASKGHEVTVFEAAPRPGGMLSLTLPSYRLPLEVVERDIASVVERGVNIVTSTRISNVQELRAQGYDAILVAVGTHDSVRLGVPGEDLPGVHRALDVLRAAKDGQNLGVEGKRVVVIGGGNVAMDAARTALRAGAARVEAISLESYEEMPAHPEEIEQAEAEGVVIRNSCGVARFVGEDGVRGVELLRCESVYDAEGRFSPKYAEGVIGVVECDAVIIAAGMRPDASGLGVPVGPGGRVQVDENTLQTSIPYVFAAGDVVTGPSMIVSAVGQGRRAAFMIDRFLRGESLDPSLFDSSLPMVDKNEVLSRQSSYTCMDPPAKLKVGKLPSGEFYPEEVPLSEEEALLAASRCLDCGVCSECQQCVVTCPASCIDLGMHDREYEVEVGAVILATGFELFPADAKPQYGYGRYKNVITGMQMDRLLAPTRPYNAVVRPSDGKIPDRIAYVLCTGSRDETVDNPLCSKICCMYSIKQNQLIMGTLPLADVTVYYMDVRAAGKGYDEFFEQAKAMGANFVRGRIAEIIEKDNGDLVLRYEDIENGGGMVEAEHDLVVLAVGVRPNLDLKQVFPDSAPALDEYLYVAEADEDLDPGRTTLPGIFVAGAAAGARDIPDSILHAGAAAIQAAAHLERLKVRA
ncbi:MAG: FAD-dependent oxidoreductase [Thermoleophilia bacterium]|nr:FAD-dependent oxidoreductase [Thermoleophilia bacterium]